jgi:type VI secretion system secreted protein VgrG
MTSTHTATATATPQVNPAVVNLRTAANYVVLAGTAITNTGTSNICGGLIGISPDGLGSITGSTMTCSGTPDVPDASSNAVTAQSDLATAYDDASTRTNYATITGEDLGGQRLTPGIYYAASSSGITTGNLILDGTGVSNPVFIFEIGSSLITAANSQVILVNATVANVFWAVDSSATLGASSIFVGNIMAQIAITFDTGATLEGRALAENSFVTFSSTNGVAYP